MSNVPLVCLHSPDIVKERLLCHAIIGRTGGKELIMRVQVHCEFIAPLLDVSTPCLNFRVDKAPADEKLTPPRKPIELENISCLPLTAQLKLQYPFQIIGVESVDTGNEEKLLSEMVCTRQRKDGRLVYVCYFHNMIHHDSVDP